MPRWWPPLSPALDGGRARAATGAWLPGTSVASVVEELKLDCTTLQRQRCVRLRACRMQRPSEGAAALHTYATRKLESKKKERKTCCNCKTPQKACIPIRLQSSTA